jgi:hypothetical protein
MFGLVSPLLLMLIQTWETLVYSFYFFNQSSGLEGVIEWWGWYENFDAEYTGNIFGYIPL